MMRNFSLAGLSTSALLALAACSPPPVRLVDAAGVDAPSIDTNVVTPDMSVTVVDANIDMGSSGTMCARVGGGCDLFAHACPMMGTTRQGCYLAITPVPDAGGVDAGFGMASTVCRPAGTAQAGQLCPMGNECDDGLICLNIAGGTCFRACCSAGDCSAGETCNPLGNDPPGVTTGYCQRPVVCTPVPNSGCAATEQCIVVRGDGTTGCAGTGTVAEGANCDAPGAACVPGTGCYGPMAGPHRCARLCRIGMAADCTGPTAHACMNVGLGMTYGLCM